MKPEQSEMTESNFDQIVPSADFVAAMLYARLFEIDPDLSMRCNGNLLDQIRKLLSEGRPESAQIG